MSVSDESLELTQPSFKFSNIVDLSDAVGSGAFKTAYNLKGQPDLLVVLLKPRYRATEIKCCLFCRLFRQFLV
jgi:hypothetical protein